MTPPRKPVPPDETPEQRQQRIREDLLARAGVTEEQVQREQRAREVEAKNLEQQEQSLRNMTRRRS